MEEKCRLRRRPSRVLLGLTCAVAALQGVGSPREANADEKVAAKHTSGFRACLTSDIGNRGAAVTAAVWPAGSTLHVRFMGGDPVVVDRVFSIATEWSKYANIKFARVDSVPAEVRVAFDMGDGSWSSVGRNSALVPVTDPTMNYGWLTPDTDMTEYRRVVLHEFGHALGMIHEHQNPNAGIPWNKNAVYALYGGPPNNWSHDQVDINVFHLYARDRVRATQFDRTSIMLYPIPPELTDGRMSVGWNVELSDADKHFIAGLYPPATH
jgi:serralysin